APSPPALPLIGHLHHLAKFADNPWDGFDSFRKRYGNVVSLQLGDKRCILVSSFAAIKEVLITRGDVFANRPDFSRYLLIFGGDRENSLALCDWSELQRFRRQIAQLAIIPRYGSDLYQYLESCIILDVNELISNMLNDGKEVLTKLDVLTMCYNIFTNYLCSQRFCTKDEEFRRQAHGFDFVFYDINQCYASDFISSLSKIGVARSHWNLVKKVCIELRYGSKLRDGNDEQLPQDFLDTVLDHHINNPKAFDWTTCHFEIGDLLGGHSAVGNLLMRLLGHLAVDEKAQEMILDEARAALNSQSEKCVRLCHRPKMPFTEASIMETLRIASSPIVPHIATEDTKLQEYDVDKGTMILFNSYHLNTSTDYWEEPQAFNPKRFLVVDENDSNSYRINKPEIYFPFSFGKRACLGYKMVSVITFAAVANIVLNFVISASLEDQIKIKEQLRAKGSLALHFDQCFDVILTARK
ncbi:ecdysone biosynthesis protein-like protein, partial [Leptotrombidium deliense]